MLFVSEIRHFKISKYSVLPVKLKYWFYVHLLNLFFYSYVIKITDYLKLKIKQITI